MALTILVVVVDQPDPEGVVLGFFYLVMFGLIALVLVPVVALVVVVAKKRAGRR